MPTAYDLMIDNPSIGAIGGVSAAEVANQPDLNVDNLGFRPGTFLYDWLLSQYSSQGANSAEKTPLSYEQLDDFLKDLAGNDKDYMDTYLNWLMENYFVNSARAYDERMSNTSFSRLMADIKNAGYNPWLALQSNIGTASNSGVNSGSVSSSTLSSKVSRSNNKNTNTRAGISSIVSTVGNILGAVARILPWLIFA